MSNNTGSGVFINGKQQAVDLLKALTPDEKSRILGNINTVNPALADELQSLCLDFNLLENLNSSQVRGLLSAFSPTIIGLSLKGLNSNFQRKILSSLGRGQAEKAFEVLNTPIQNEARDGQRARDKIQAALIQAVKNKTLQLNQ